MSAARERWQRWKARKRPRLRPGEPLTFYDPTGLVPLARVRVESIERSFGDGTTIILRDEARWLERMRVRS